MQEDTTSPTTFHSVRRGSSHQTLFLLIRFLDTTKSAASSNIHVPLSMNDVLSAREILHASCACPHSDSCLFDSHSPFGLPSMLHDGDGGSPLPWTSIA